VSQTQHWLAGAVGAAAKIGVSQLLPHVEGHVKHNLFEKYSPIHFQELSELTVNSGRAVVRCSQGIRFWTDLALKFEISGLDNRISHIVYNPAF